VRYKKITFGVLPHRKRFLSLLGPQNLKMDRKIDCEPAQKEEEKGEKKKKRREKEKKRRRKKRRKKEGRKEKRRKRCARPRGKHFFSSTSEKQASFRSAHAKWARSFLPPSLAWGPQVTLFIAATLLRRNDVITIFLCAEPGVLMWTNICPESKPRRRPLHQKALPAEKFFLPIFLRKQFFS